MTRRVEQTRAAEELAARIMALMADGRERTVDDVVTRLRIDRRAAQNALKTLGMRAHLLADTVCAGPRDDVTCYRAVTA